MTASLSTGTPTVLYESATISKKGTARVAKTENVISVLSARAKVSALDSVSRSPPYRAVVFLSDFPVSQNAPPLRPTSRAGASISKV